jgi:hypothetical protein
MSGLASGQATLSVESGMPAACMYARAIFWLPSANIAMVGATTRRRATSASKLVVATCTVVVFLLFHAAMIGSAAGASSASTSHGPPR